MSLWVETPELLDSRTGRRLVGFVDPNWSLESAVWQSDAKVTMRLRKFPGDHAPDAFEITVDCASGTAALGPEACALPSLEQALERARTPGLPRGAPR